MENKKIQITLSDKSLDMLNAICEEQQQTKSLVIAAAIEEYQKILDRKAARKSQRKK